MAEDKHIAYVHSAKHIKLIKSISSKEFDSRRQRIASKFNSIYLNKGSSEAAYLAAGSVIEVMCDVSMSIIAVDYFICAKTFCSCNLNGVSTDKIDLHFL